MQWKNNISPNFMDLCHSSTRSKQHKSNAVEERHKSNFMVLCHSSTGSLNYQQQKRRRREKIEKEGNILLHNSQAPDVDLRPILTARDEEFWSCVLWTATVSLEEAARSLGIAESEI